MCRGRLCLAGRSLGEPGDEESRQLSESHEQEPPPQHAPAPAPQSAASQPPPASMAAPPPCAAKVEYRLSSAAAPQLVQLSPSAPSPSPCRISNWLPQSRQRYS